MEDDDELPPSPATSDPVANEEDHKDTGSPFSVSPDPSNGRIVTLALPIQNHRSTPSVGASGGGGGGGGREDCWSEDGTAVLIEAWGERYSEQNRGIVKQKQWDEVAEIVNSRISGAGKPGKTDVQCKNRMDTVKRKYKSEKAKISAGGGVSGWIFFDRLDRLLGNANPNSSTSAARISNQQTSSPPISLRNRAFLQRQTKRPIVDSDSDSPESSDSLPPVIDRNFQRNIKRQKIDFDSPPPSRPPRFDAASRATSGTGIQTKANDWRNSVIELTKVIFMFSEAYEQAESEKLQQMVEMEKHRMKFAKELELQRMKFLMKTQLQLSRLTNHHQGRRHSHANDENNANGNNNSDDCSN